MRLFVNFSFKLSLVRCQQFCGGCQCSKVKDAQREDIKAGISLTISPLLGDLVPLPNSFALGSWEISLDKI